MPLISEDDLVRARLADPFPIVASVVPGARLSRNGRRIEAPGVLRADQKPDGGWLACDWYGGGIGDAIAMVRCVTQKNFSDAVTALLGCPPSPAPLTWEERQTRPRVPPQVPPSLGRAYLEGRGLLPATILEAENARILLYVRGGVLFVGRDETGVVRHAALRLFVPMPERLDDRGKMMPPLNKFDLKGSDKSFAVRLPGDLRDGLILVEGGINMLAAREICKRLGMGRPWVLATGGVGGRSWLLEPHAHGLTENAERVVLLGENERSGNEPSPIKQAATDALRERLCGAVAELRNGEIPAVMRPPERFKDVADWNLAVSTETDVMVDFQNYKETPCATDGSVVNLSL